MTQKMMQKMMQKVMEISFVCDKNLLKTFDVSLLSAVSTLFDYEVFPIL